MDEPGDDRPARPGSLGRAGRPPRPGIWGVTRSMRWLEHAQDVITVVVGIVLIVLAAILLVSGIADFVHSLSETGVLSAGSIINAATSLLDEVLLVLILIEIVHTVVLSLRSHRLVAQPFIIVGLVAVSREILFVLGGHKLLSTPLLALLIAMVVVFVAALIAVTLFDRRGRAADADQEIS